MVDAGSWFELTATGEQQLNLWGVLDGWNVDGTPRITPLTTSEVPVPVYAQPPAPIVTGTMPTRTTATINWEPVVDESIQPVTQWTAQRNISLDNGTTYAGWGPVTGTPFAANVLTTTDTGIPTQTSPEVLVRYRVRGTNAYGIGTFGFLDLQWGGNPDQAPTQPTNFRLTGTPTTTTRTFAWNIDSTVPSPPVTELGIFEGDIQVVSGIGATQLTGSWTGMQPGSVHTNVNVRRYNGQWSPASNAVSFTQPTTPPPPTSDILVGCSTSDNDHGGTENWDGWRVYDRGKLYNYVNRAEPNRPLFMAYSENGPNIQGTYATVRQHVIDELDAFYYGNAAGTAGSGTASTRSVRWGIKLYWSNGNENHDKGDLGPSGRSTPGTAQDVPGYVQSQRGLYDGCHYIDPATSSRRFPDAYAGSNPTHEAEFNGVVQEYLHPSARYHDFVMWSMYPPGRQSTETDPTYNWPSFNVGDRTNRQLGFMIRTFYRTQQAQFVARNPASPDYSGDPNFPMMICTGEWGIGDAGFLNGVSQTSQSTGTATQRAQYRPYYAVHGMYGGLDRLSTQFSLPVPFACWWDNQSDSASPQNVLTDEPTTTNPSTRVAIQAWKSYNHLYGGTHPANWSHITTANLAAWQHTGTPV